MLHDSDSAQPCDGSSSILGLSHIDVMSQSPVTGFSLVCSLKALFLIMSYQRQLLKQPEICFEKVGREGGTLDRQAGSGQTDMCL